MYQVATLSSFGLPVPIGPAKNVNRIYSNSSIFGQHNIELLGPFCPDVGYTAFKDYETSFNRSIKESIKMYLRKTSLGNWAMYRLTHMRRARQAIDSYYSSTNDKSDLIVFRDFTVAYEYLKRGGVVPFILVMHNDGTNDMFYSDSAYPLLGRNPFRSIIDARFYRVVSSASGIFFLSQKAIDNFTKRYPEISCPMSWYHQGLSVPEAPSPIDKPDCSVAFVSVGTVCKRKNQRMIIKAFASIKDKYSVLFIVGDGPDLGPCKELAESLGVSERVFFTGSLDYPGNILKICDVYVSASVDEGVPNAAVEAMSFGLPLILTDVGSCSELIKDNGILIKVQESQLVDAMDYISLHPEKRKKFSLKSSELYSEEYTTQKMCIEHARFYKEVISFHTEDNKDEVQI